MCSIPLSWRCLLQVFHHLYLDYVFHSLLTWDSKECTGERAKCTHLKWKQKCHPSRNSALAITWRRSNLIFLCCRYNFSFEGPWTVAVAGIKAECTAALQFVGISSQVTCEHAACPALPHESPRSLLGPRRAPWERDNRGIGEELHWKSL